MDEAIKVFLAAVLGGLGARRLGLPCGTLLGAVTAASLVALVDGRFGFMPAPVTPITQVLAATMLSFSVNPRLFATLRAHRRLAVASLSVTAALWGTTAWAAGATGLLESSGTILGSAPAGSMVAMLGSDRGVSLAVVSLLLVLRVVLVAGVVSLYLRLRATSVLPRLGARTSKAWLAWAER